MRRASASPFRPVSNPNKHLLNDQDKENEALINSKRFRPHSLAGPPPSMSTESPIKKARKDLKPRRSILKPRLSAPNGDETTTILSNNAAGDDTGTFTRNLRRVSFAPTAHMREFEKDPEESFGSTASSDSVGDVSSVPSIYPNLPNNLPNYNDDDNQSIDMDLTSDVRYSDQEDSIIDHEHDKDDDDDDNGSVDMDMTGNISRRISVLPPQQPQQSIAMGDEYQEDDNQSVDMDISNFLGGNTTRYSMAPSDPILQGQGQSQQDDDQTMDMDMATNIFGDRTRYSIVGGRRISNLPRRSSEAQDDQTVDMDVTTNIRSRKSISNRLSILSAARPNDIGSIPRRSSVQQSSINNISNSQHIPRPIASHSYGSRSSESSNQNESSLTSQQSSMSSFSGVQNSANDQNLSGSLDMSISSSSQQDSIDHLQPFQPPPQQQQQESQFEVEPDEDEPSLNKEPVQEHVQGNESYRHELQDQQDGSTDNSSLVHQKPTTAEEPGDLANEVDKGLESNYENRDEEIVDNAQDLEEPSLLRQDHVHEQEQPNNDTSHGVTDMSIDSVNSDASQSFAPAPLPTLGQFLDMAGIYFNSGFPMRKRKSIAPNDKQTPKDKANLASHVIAATSLLPFLEMYHMMSRELRTSLAENDEFLSDVQEGVSRETPKIISEYLTADEDTRAAISTQFKLTKAYFRLEVKEEWYTYRSRVFEEICNVLQQHSTNLGKDLEALDSLQPTFDSLIPSLRKRKEELQAEVEKEKARQVELESCDQEHLASLREAILEQKGQLEDMAREKADAESQLARLNNKMEELELQSNEAQESIDESRAICKDIKYLTKAEAYRLRDELEGLQRIHGWELIKITKSHVDLCHRNEIMVQFSPSSGKMALRLLDENMDNQDYNSQVKLQVTTFLFNQLQSSITDTDPKIKIRAKLRKLSNIWTKARHMRNEIMKTMTKFTCQQVSYHKKRNQLQLIFRIYSQTRKISLDISITMSGEETCVSELGCSAAVVYNGRGHDSDNAYDLNLAKEVMYVMRDALSEGESRSLLDACVRVENM